PATLRARTAENRNVQRYRNLKVALALAAHHNEHGRYPKTLAELSPRYVENVPKDFFTNEPLKYQPRQDGYLLYSVGANLQDDGGAWLGEEPAGDDIRVGMPLPKDNR
ncbi:MAG: hypothetical protein KY476_18315, partial [Planctomycetes bacterium]|nr:hypothetical protein [Planctomycetota bacterium]